MKRSASLLLTMGVLAWVNPAQAQTETPLKDQKDKVSYSIGADIGTKLREQKLDLTPAAVAAGIKDALSGTKLALTPEEMHAVLVAYEAELRAKHASDTKIQAEKNKQVGDAFLAENKKKEGVQTLPSGLQYKIITQGKGQKPKATDTVTTHYRGTFIDGTEFDSSYERGEPVTFPVSGVIPGWTEALQLMPVGSKWQLFVPAALAYGERGYGSDIPPNSTLVFEVQLLGIQDPKATK